MLQKYHNAAQFCSFDWLWSAQGIRVAHLY
jgi:hypothetical protein